MTCKTCGGSLPDGGYASRKFCDGCNRERKIQREHDRRVKLWRQRPCERCGGTLPALSRSPRCDKCRLEHERERKRNRARERYATDSEYRERVLEWNRETDRKLWLKPEYRQRQKENARVRREQLLNDADWVERERERHREAKRKARLDPEYRERVRKTAHEKYHGDPEHRERRLERDRQRYATDPAYREHIRERNRTYKDAVTAAIEAQLVVDLDALADRVRESTGSGCA